MGLHIATLAASHEFFTHVRDHACFAGTKEQLGKWLVVPPSSFRVGVRGSPLDVIERVPLWKCPLIIGGHLLSVAKRPGQSGS